MRIRFLCVKCKELLSFIAKTINSDNTKTVFLKCEECDFMIALEIEESKESLEDYLKKYL